MKLKRSLRTLNDLVRLGVALARFCAGAFSSRTSGRTSRTKGRICFLRIGAPTLLKAAIAGLALLRALNGGSSFGAVERRTRAKVVTLPSVLVVWCRAPGNSWMARLML